MKDRRVIFKCQVGSHLYGLSRPESDEDFAGVFLPAPEELLGIHSAPEFWSNSVKVSDTARNSKGDIDDTLHSLRAFMGLAGKGHSVALEMLFCPEDKVLVTTPEWKEVLRRRDLFLSKSGVAPFIGFARSQMHRAVIKGENLNLMRELLKGIAKLEDLCVPVSDHFESKEFTDQVPLFGCMVDVLVNEHGFPQIHIAGKDYDFNLNVKVFASRLETLVSKYGSRVQAAALETYDYKALLHALRQLGEAEEFLAHGRITLPRPEPENTFLRSIRKREWPASADFDLFGYMDERITNLDRIKARSSLPDNPDWEGIDHLCFELYRGHIQECAWS